MDQAKRASGKSAADLVLTSTEDILRLAQVDYRDALAERMTPEQLAEAQRRARAWDSAHPR